jgi:hypothetical protein
MIKKSNFIPIKKNMSKSGNLKIKKLTYLTYLTYYKEIYCIIKRDILKRSWQNIGALKVWEKLEVALFLWFCHLVEK